MDTPITHGGIDRRKKVCRCNECGYISECKPMDDFYTKPGDESGPLYCERCVFAVLDAD